MLTAVLVLLAVTAASFGRTRALWRDSTPLGDDTLATGRLVLLAAGSHAYAFDSLRAVGLAPGGSAQAPLTLSNGGSVDLDYRLRQATVSGAAPLAGAMTLVVDRISPTTTCATGVDVAPPTPSVARLYAGPVAAARSSSSTRLEPGAADLLCVRVGVLGSTPLAAQAGSARVTLTFGSTST